LVVFVWRLVNHISICCVASLIVCPMHGVILIFARVVAKSFPPFTPHQCGGELHQFLWYNP
jgi:hypothetical protein